MSAGVMEMRGRRGGARGLAWLVVVVVAVVAQLGVGLFTISSGLVAPLWAVIALGLVWAVAAGGLVVLARRRSLAILVVPVANAIVWFAAVSAGEAWLGWTG